jgi:hypothetical protein
MGLGADQVRGSRPAARLSARHGLSILKNAGFATEVCTARFRCSTAMVTCYKRSIGRRKNLIADVGRSAPNFLHDGRYLIL